MAGFKLVFPDIPDPPRKKPRASAAGPTASPGQRGLWAGVETPLAEAQRVVKYEEPTEQAKPQRYVGFVRDWDDKVLFGRRIEGPRWVTLECKAVSLDHAHTLLHMMAQRQGYALGGVQHIRQEDKA